MSGAVIGTVLLGTHAFLQGQADLPPAWVGSGLAAAIIITAPARDWPALLVGWLFAWMVDRHAMAGFPYGPALVFLQALVARRLLTRSLGDRRPRVESTTDVGALISVASQAALGVSLLALVVDLGTGSSTAGTLAALSVRFTGHALGIFLVTSLVLSIQQRPRHAGRRGFVARTTIAVSMLLVLSGVGFLTPWNWKGVTSVTVVITVPVVIWLALRLGAQVTLSLVTILAVIGTGGTLSGHGAFAAPERTVQQRELLVNVYVFLSAALSLVIFATIAERERALRRAREARNRLQLVLEHSTAGITLYEADASGELRCVDLNARTAEILYDGDLDAARAAMIGRTRAELAARLYTDAGSAAQAAALVREAIDSRQSVNETLMLEGPQGWTVFDTAYTPVFDEDGRMTHLLVASHDVTERQRAATALAHSEARFRRIFESTVLGVFSWKGNGAITDANEAFLSLLGYSRDDLEAGRLDWNLLTPPEYAELNELKHAEMRVVGHCDPFEKEYLRKDGGRVTVLVAGSLWAPHTDEGFATVLDVTSQRQAERALRSITHGTSALTGEAFFQSLVRELHEALGADHVLVATVEGDPPAVARTISFWSGGAYAEPLTYDLKNTPCETVVQGELCYFASGVRRLFPEDAALAGLHVDSYLGVPLVDVNGRAGGLLAVMHGRPLDRPDWARTVLNVFAGRAAAELQRLGALDALRESEERLATVLDTVSERLSLWAIDESGRTRLVSVNRSAREVIERNGTGPFDDGVIGSDLLDVLRLLFDRMPGTDPAALEVMMQSNRDSLARLLTTRAPTRHREIVEHAGGLTANEVETSPVFGDGGRITHVLRSAKDIADQIRAEVARDAMEARERQSQKLEAIGTLAGGIAHDFNNILTGILGNVELVRAEMAASDDAAARLDEAIRSVHRARSVVRQILTFSRTEDGERRLVRIADVVHDTFELLRATVPSSVALVTQVTDEDATVLADSGQVALVLMNLCTNAAHAVRTRGGQVIIGQHSVDVAEGHPAMRHGLPPGRYVCLHVEDDGIGMDDATLQRIFEPFFTTKPQGEGTGLGLPVVHGVLRAHGGAILVQSQPGVGTRVEVYLPHAAAAAPARSIEADLAGRGEHVLFVDDETVIIDVGQRLLRRLGYRVSAFRRPVEGLAAFVADPASFDLVVSDLTMPEMNGLQLARHIAEHRPDLPFILTTGYAGSHIDEVHEMANVVGVMDKPFDRDMFARTIRAALDREAAGRMG